MEPLHTLGGGGLVSMKFQVEDAFTVAGIPTIAGVAADAGLQKCTTTASIMTYGLSVDTATAATGALLTVIVNPDLVIRAKISGGSTADTALTVATCTVATSTVAFDVSGLAPNSPDLDDGVVWGYTGVNAGVYRAIVATDADTITVTNVWPTIEAVGDQFLLAARCPGVLAGVTLTSNLAQVDGTDDAGDIVQATNETNDSYSVIGAEFNDSSNSGTTNSFYHLVAGFHAF